MNSKNFKLLSELYQKYLAVGAVILLSTWIAGLFTITFLPGPYTFDLFGLVAQRNGDSSSVTIGSMAIVTSLIVIPLVLAAIELFNRKA